MMYQYMILADGTEITHTHIFEEDGVQKVEVYFERPKDGGFDCARCQLPGYIWQKREGYTDSDMKILDELMHSNAHLFYKYAACGGVQIA